MKTFKSILIVVGLLGTMVLTQSLVGINGSDRVVTSENPDNDKVIKLKIIKNVNGEETLIDTTITITEGMNVDEILSSLNIDLPAGCDFSGNGESHVSCNVIINDDDSDAEGGKTKCIKKVIIKDGENGDEIEKAINIAISDGENGGKCKMIFIGDENGDSIGCCKKKIVINEGGKTMKCVVIGDDDKDMKCVKSPDGKAKDVVMKMQISDDGEVTKQIWISENGETTEFDGNVDVEVIKDDKNMIIVVAKVMIDDLDESDTKALAKAGIKPSEEKLDLNDLNFSPNPNNGKFNLTFGLENKGDVNIQIFDMNGKSVYQENKKNFKGKYSNDIDISGNEKGVYFLNITQGKNSTTKKVVLQ